VLPFGKHNKKEFDSAGEGFRSPSVLLVIILLLQKNELSLRRAF